LLVTGLAGAAALLMLPARGANADTTAALTQLTGFHQMVVDDVGGFSSDGYVFLSEGTGSAALATDGPGSAAGIVVTDLAGNYVTTLDAGNGVEGLALSADGGTLYASLAGDNAVAAIDVSSITPSTTDPTPAAAGPCSYTVSYGSSTRSYVVTVTPLASTLYLTGPTTVKGSTVNASGDLILGTNTSPPVGTPITITRSLAGGGSTTLPTVSTQAGAGSR
jgi:hypothetical protein